MGFQQGQSMLPLDIKETGARQAEIKWARLILYTYKLAGKYLEQWYTVLFYYNLLLQFFFNY